MAPATSADTVSFWISLLGPLDGFIVPWRRKPPVEVCPELSPLYLYGGRKPIMFHTQRWLDLLRQRAVPVRALKTGTTGS